MWLCCCGVFAANLLHRQFHQTPDLGQDIYQVYREGQNILLGINPYGRIAGSDMSHNQKYATYLPTTYLLSAWTQAAGFRDFSSWLICWRFASTGSWSAIGLLLFCKVYGTQRRLGPALLAASLWLFNRWSLHVLSIAHCDFFALVWLVWASLPPSPRPLWCWIALGGSLSIKHVGLLCLPLLLVVEWQSVPVRQRSRRVGRALLATAVVPALVGLPYLAAHPVAFANSMLFSATREAMAFAGLSSLDTVLGLSGLLSRLPLLGLLLASGWLLLRGGLGLVPAMAITLLGFTWFNPVFFPQYVVWPIPFLLLLALDRGEGADYPTRVPLDHSAWSASAIASR